MILIVINSGIFMGLPEPLHMPIKCLCGIKS